MTRKDEFDDPEGFQSAFGKIAQAMEQSRFGLRQRRPLIGILTVMVALFVLFAVFWSTYPRGKDAAENGPVLVIRADTAPYKTAPEDPGGMEIPYRDSTVFETLRSADADDREESKVESLLPPPEQPIERAQMFAGLKTEPIEEDAEAPAEAEPDIGPTPSDEKAFAVPAPVQEMPAASSGTETRAAATEPAAGDAAVKTMPESDSGGGTHYVQLGSLKDRATADAEWTKLQKQFPSELGSLTLRVQQADLGAKGKFFRIQAGAVSKEQAQKICSSISGKRAGGCLVVAR
jgi:hypothetical protein